MKYDLEELIKKDMKVEESTLEELSTAVLQAIEESDLMKQGVNFKKKLNTKNSCQYFSILYGNRNNCSKCSHVSVG